MTNPENNPRSRQWTARYGGIVLAISAAPVVPMIAARYHALLELFTHFIVYYCLGALVSAALSASARRWKWMGAGIAVAALYAVALVPYLPLSMTAAAGARDIRVMTANVLTSNRDVACFLRSVRTANPDILAVQEMDAWWEEKLRVLEKEYPYAETSPRSDNFGIGLYSRVPLEEITMDYLQPHNLDSITAMLRVDETVVHLRVVHTLPPMGGTMAAARNAQMLEIADWAREHRPCIVAGDLNTTMWSPYYRDFIRASGLSSTRERRGIFGTWPVSAGVLAMPIDHILISPGITTVAMERGTKTGSDHIPLIADLAVSR